MFDKVGTDRQRLNLFRKTDAAARFHHRYIVQVRVGIVVGMACNGCHRVTGSATRQEDGSCDHFYVQGHFIGHTVGGTQYVSSGVDCPPTKVCITGGNAQGHDVRKLTQRRWSTACYADCFIIE